MKKLKWHEEPKRNAEGFLTWQAYDGVSSITAAQYTYGWMVRTKSGSDTFSNGPYTKTSAVEMVKRLCTLPLWPEWITPPTRNRGGRVVWELTHSRTVEVDASVRGWQVITRFDDRRSKFFKLDESVAVTKYVHEMTKLAPRVLIETPFGNSVYALKAKNDSVNRGEAPIARCYDHLSWVSSADALVIYEDYGVDAWMQEAIDEAMRLGVAIKRRQLPLRVCPF